MIDICGTVHIESDVEWKPPASDIFQVFYKAKCHIVTLFDVVLI